MNDKTGADYRAMRDRLIEAALRHVPFDGWTRMALTRAAKDVGIEAADADALFPGNSADMIAWHSRLADRRMLAALAEMDLAAMKIRERIATAVMIRLTRNAGDREAVRRGLAVLSRPRHAGLALQLLYRTVDDMWFAAGDRSTDWNFYSKRLLLGGVYSSTLLVWLNDQSEDHAETRAFLDRRIENVMQIPKIRSRISALAAAGPTRVRAMRSFCGGMRGAR